MFAHPTRWFRPEDFMQYTLPEKFYIGYEANSRLAELTNEGLLEDTYAKEDTANGWKKSRKKMWKVKKEFIDLIKYAPALKKDIAEAKKTVKNKMFRNKYTPILEDDEE